MRPSGEQVVHELANLLDGSMRHVGLAMSRLQADGSLTDDRLIEQLATASRAMQQMAQVMRRWMEHSQGRSPAAIHAHGTPLGVAIAEVVSLLTPAATAMKVRMDVDIDPAVAALPAQCVPTILLNALRNSLDALASAKEMTDAAPGYIEVRGTVTDGRVCITVRDDGPGIEGSLLDEAGDFRFGQTTRSSGHGVGLLLCRQLAESLAGALRIENVSPRGALLTLRYPLPTNATTDGDVTRDG
mgnify:FL=1